MRSRFTAGLLATTLGAGLLTIGAPMAHASSKGRKNTMYALGAVTAYSLLKGKTTQGLIAGAGTAYAYKRYKDARDDERRYGSYSTRSRSSRSRYRTQDTGGDFQFPDGYYDNGGRSGNSGSYDGGYQNGQYQGGKGGQYQYDSGQYQGGKGGQYQYGGGQYQYDNGQYQRGKSGSYSTDGWRTRQYGGGQGQYRSRYADDDRPPGWSRGRKQGWRRR